MGANKGPGELGAPGHMRGHQALNTPVTEEEEGPQAGGLLRTPPRICSSRKMDSKTETVELCVRTAAPPVPTLTM